MSLVLALFAQYTVPHGDSAQSRCGVVDAEKVPRLGRRFPLWDDGVKSDQLHMLRESDQVLRCELAKEKEKPAIKRNFEEEVKGSCGSEILPNRSMRTREYL
jgi:hypothetical protein